MKQLNPRHSSFKKQNSDSRLSRRMFDLTSGKDVGEGAKLQVKLKPLVGPNGERMTRSSHRFLVTSDPNDAAVYMGDMSCHIFNYLSASAHDCLHFQPFFDVLTDFGVKSLVFNIFLRFFFQ